MSKFIYLFDGSCTAYGSDYLIEVYPYRRYVCRYVKYDSVKGKYDGKLEFCLDLLLE